MHTSLQKDTILFHSLIAFSSSSTLIDSTFALVCLCSFGLHWEFFPVLMAGGGGRSGFNFFSGLGPLHTSQNDFSKEFSRVQDSQCHFFSMK